MLYVSSNEGTSFTDKQKTKPSGIKRNFFRERPRTINEITQGVSEGTREMVYTSPLRVKIEEFGTNYFLNEVAKKREESRSAALLEYMKRKGKYLLSKIKEDWHNAVKPRFILDPETDDIDKILRYLFNK